LVYEANPGNGVDTHYVYIYADLGSGQQTLSFHFKADIDSWVYITSQVDGVIQRMWFNLTGSGGYGANVPAGWTALITPLPNGWYRCSVTFSAVNNSVYNGFGLATMDQQSSYMATVGNGVYEWGQQFQHGALTDYQANLSPCLTFSKSADAGSVAAGSSIGYTIAAFNQASPALATTLNDPLPSGPGINWSISPTYGGPGTCAITGAVGSQTLACDFSTLAANVGASVHITSGTSASSCGTYSNTATATALSSSFQAGATTTVQCPSLSISKTHTGNFVQGQNGATYTVTVSNAANAAPTNGTVTVTDSVPSGLTLVSMAGTGWTCPGTAANNCTRSGVLAAGASYPAITVTVNVAANAGTALSNLASVSGGGSAGSSSSDVTVINGGNSGQQALRFVPLTPCRVADTRNATGPFGGPALATGSSRDFVVPSSSCGIPASAAAYSLNVTVVPLGPLQYISVWPAGQPQPVVSTLNSFDGRIKANAAIVPAGLNGAFSVFATDPTHVVVDIDGYFVPASGSQNLTFYPVTPCRVADTRNPTGTFGAPALAGGVPRTFPVPSSNCGIPASAQAYAFNMTVVPTVPVGYLTTWPAGSSQPIVSTLNAPTGTVTSNAAIVPAGVNGAITVYVTNATDLIIDINGYFAPPGAGSLDFYTATPCRVLDTRNAAGPLGGPLMGAGQARSFNVPSSTCGIPATARAYSLNATVLPSASLQYLTLWGSGNIPIVSTLNSYDGTVVANAALVPAGASGEVTAFTTNLTHLLLDINGYFR
jgi:uncharacterized repeat protein (TIGR01451 family)